MKDLNFFEPYLQQEQISEEHRSKRKMWLVSVFLIILLIPAGFFGVVFSNNQQIKTMNAELSTPEMQEKLKRVEDKQNVLRVMEATIPILKQADKALSGTDYINEPQLQTIVDAIPQNVIFDELTLGIEGCQIFGRALNKAAVAEMQYNLRATGLTEGLLLNNLKLEGSEYAYDITFKLKGVKTDEAH